MKTRYLLVFLLLLAVFFLGYEAGVHRTPASTAIQMAEPTPAVNLSKTKYKAVSVPRKYKKRSALDKGFVLGFAQFLYGVSYVNCQATTLALKNMVTDDLAGMFFSQYLNEGRVKEISDLELVLSFTPTREIIPVEVGESLDKFLVEGVLTTRSGLPGFQAQTEPLAMIIGFSHGPKTDGRISVFERVEPDAETVQRAAAMAKTKKGS